MFGYNLCEAETRKKLAEGEQDINFYKSPSIAIPMKILSLHCDYIKFKPVKPALKGAVLEKAEEKQIEVKEPLVIFTAIEKQDESNKQILEEYVKNILDLLCYFFHLSQIISSGGATKMDE